MYDESKFWPAFKRAGFLTPAVVTPVGGDPMDPVDVEYTRPDEKMTTGVQSSQHAMRYQHADLPNLAEADLVAIGTDNFRVRETPYVDGYAPTGFHRIALLTLLSGSPP